MANNARTISDLERKYNFASLLGLNKNVKMNEKSITRIQGELSNMLNSLIINLKDVLDIQSDVSLWFYTGIPTTSNEPYINWENPEEHYGDIYYNQETGYLYQYSQNGWGQNTDINLIQAMALTNVELDTTIDHERKVYFVQPVPPYSSGDWWILEDGTLKICQIGKTTGEYETNDFIVSSKYVTTVASKTGDALTVLKGTVTEITENYVKYTDLETGGSTIINGANITTGTINTDNVTVGNGNVQIDSDGIKLNNGAKVIGENGLMNTYLFTNGDSFEICGYESDDPYGAESTTVHRKGLKLTFNIPTGLNITSARLILYHAPTLWGWNVDGINSSGWGYCRNLKIYKANNINDRKYMAQYMSEYYESNDTQYSEITNALGVNGWTPSVPNDTTHNTEQKISEDIKSSISVGLNELFIETETEISGYIEISEICSKTAFLYAMLKIDGYMTYEEDE